MEPINFCYWLQGFLKLQNPEQLSENQIEEIKKQLLIVINNKQSISYQGNISTSNPSTTFYC